MRIFFERKKKRLIFKEFVAVDSVKKDAGKIKEKGISIQMRIQKNKGKKIFLHSPCEKEEPFGGGCPGKRERLNRKP